MAIEAGLRRLRRIALPGLLCLCGTAAAEPLKICIDDFPHPPYIYPDRDGSLQRLTRRAAAGLGRAVSFIPAPLARCRELVRTGAVDADLAMAYIDSNLPLFAFPMAQGQVDRSRAAVFAARTLVYRRVGARVDWNGKTFLGLTTAALVPHAVLLLQQRLARLGVAYDDGGRGAESNFDKLLAGRAQVAICYALDADGLLAQPRYAGKIEALPQPFSEESYYLAFGKPYYARHRAEAEALWTAIGRLRR